MRLPPKKRPGNPVLARDWNQLIVALEARTPRPSHGMELVFTSAGFSYRARKVAGGNEVAGDPCPFGEIITIPTHKRRWLHWMVRHFFLYGGSFSTFLNRF